MFRYHNSKFVNFTKFCGITKTFGEKLSKTVKKSTFLWEALKKSLDVILEISFNIYTKLENQVFISN